MEATALFNQVLAAITAHGAAMTPRLVPFGTQLLFYFGVIAISWKVITAVLADTDIRGILVKLLPLSIVLGVASWLIKDLDSHAEAFVSGFDWIAITVTGAAPGSSPLDATMGSLGRVANSLWVSMGSSGDTPPDWIDTIKNTLSGGAGFWIKVFTLAIMIIVSAITAAIYVMSQVLVGVGIALAPVFIPFIALPKLNFVFEGWLKFVWTAAVMRLVGQVMLSFGAALTDSLLTLDRVIMQAGQDPRTLNLMASIAVLFVAIVQLILATQIPNIAQALTSGGVGGALDTSPVSKVASAGLKGARAAGDAGKALGNKAIDAFRKPK